jgi:hypothetical protein
VIEHVDVDHTTVVQILTWRRFRERGTDAEVATLRDDQCGDVLPLEQSQGIVRPAEPDGSKRTRFSSLQGGLIAMRCAPNRQSCGNAPPHEQSLLQTAPIDAKSVSLQVGHAGCTVPAECLGAQASSLVSVEPWPSHASGSPQDELKT